MIKKNLWLLFLLCIACEDQSLMKHPLDKSQTRTITLDNKLKVYLLSDPDFNVSAASLAVEVGHLDNPDNRLGIAHFLEHMLFLGTEKYPEVDDYAYNDGKVTMRALDKMKALKAENKPFFMAVGYVSPHLPFIQPKKYWDLYNHDEIQLADNAYQPKNSPYIAMHSQHDNAELRNMYLDIPAKGLLSDEMSRNLVHGYYASVSYMDALIGDLINGLDALGLRENTTVILWSDHGFFLGEHGFWCKHSTFYEAIKIPFIISSPGFAKNRTTDSFTELVDVYPTLCELTGMVPPKYIHGKSLIPVMKNPELKLKDEIYTRYKQGEAVVDENYSYTEFFQGEKYIGNMLYDLKQDSKQNKDISEYPTNAATIRKYSKKLKTMRDFVNRDPLKTTLD